MNPLAELYSYIDGKKRQLRGLLSDPVETINQGLLNFRDDQNNFLNLAENAYPGVFPGSKTVLNTPEQVAGLRKQFGDKATDMAFAATFIGPNAKTWDALSAKKAQELAAQGVDPRKIWSETGTWKGPDGKWRQEIPDNTASLNKLSSSAVDYMTGPGPATYPAKGQDAISHERLFNSYPQLKTIDTTYSNNHPSSGEMRVWNGNPQIEFGAKHQNGDFLDKETSKSTLLHELQHAIQQREGWARGGSEASMVNQNIPIDKEKLAKINAQIERLGKKAVKQGGYSDADNLKFLQLNDTKNNLYLTPFEAYRRLAGEAEARATQARIPLDAAQRRALFPEDSYDVPIGQLIIRGLLN